jgi:leader peptidase (prepilin peptidase)/N-methyltransferase
VILLARWAYRFLRGRKGSDMAEAKLMLLVAAWLGLSYTFLAFVLGVLMAVVAAGIVLTSRWEREAGGEWRSNRPPLGTFLCVGGIVSALWGSSIIAAYLRWASFY